MPKFCKALGEEFGSARPFITARSEVNFDYFLMALTINSRTIAPTVAITSWPINP